MTEKNPSTSSQSGAPPGITDVLSQVKNFQSRGLRKVNPTVTTLDGRRIEETLSPIGNYVPKSITPGYQGFIGDLSLDLQVGEVLPGLYVGCQDAAHDITTLEKHKVTHILNVATLVGNYDPERFIYKNMNIKDLPETRIIDQFEEAFTFIDEGRAAGCVLVHCNAGWSRAPTICIAYVMKTEGKSVQEAYDHVREARPTICPNEGFVKQLRQYEVTLKNKK